MYRGGIELVCWRCVNVHNPFRSFGLACLFQVRFEVLSHIIKKTSTNNTDHLQKKKNKYESIYVCACALFSYCSQLKLKFRFNHVYIIINSHNLSILNSLLVNFFASDDKTSTVIKNI